MHSSLMWWKWCRCLLSKHTTAGLHAMKKITSKSVFAIHICDTKVTFKFVVNVWENDVECVCCSWHDGPFQHQALPNKLLPFFSMLQPQKNVVMCLRSDSYVSIKTSAYGPIQKAKVTVWLLCVCFTAISGWLCLFCAFYLSSLWKCCFSCTKLTTAFGIWSCALTFNRSTREELPEWKRTSRNKTLSN